MSYLGSCQPLTCFVLKTAQQDKEQVQYPADAKESKSEQPDDSGADLANIETVTSQVTEKQAQEERYPLARVDVATAVFVDVGIVVDHIDDDPHNDARYLCNRRRGYYYISL